MLVFGGVYTEWFWAPVNGRNQMGTLEFYDPNKWSSLVGPLRKKKLMTLGTTLQYFFLGFLVEHQETPVGWLLDRGWHATQLHLDHHEPIQVSRHEAIKISWNVSQGLLLMWRKFGFLLGWTPGGKKQITPSYDGSIQKTPWHKLTSWDFCYYQPELGAASRISWTATVLASSKLTCPASYKSRRVSFTIQ